jgi:hypothetical protein
MIKIAPITMDDLHSMKKMSGLFAHIDIEYTGHALISVGAGFSMIEDGQCIGCGGVIPRWSGVGEVWIAVSENLRRRPLLLVKETLRVMDMLNTRSGFHRLQLHIPSTDTGLKRWAESLGFTFEGRMLQYGPDKRDHDLYARIF